MKPKQHLEFVKVDLSGGWQQVPGYPPGFTQKILASDIDEKSKKGSRTRLLKIDAGAFTTEPFVHDHWEEVYVVQGDLVVGNDKQGKGGQMVRSAGTAAQVLAKEATYAQLKLPSGEVRMVHIDCRATIGQVGNLEHENISVGKAGRTRWKGRRSAVRGIAMNPVDHPHGGGEGRSKGNHPQTPWGKPTKGYKTRHNKRTDRWIVARRKVK